ncbi:hypothetical protein BJ508DRAFT_313812 [Ascobolus immersus RN42]|uniref:Uncharacterized protein n=1 Tax=Ascobolus immersus RN42 TaxID=1160509 RepID=A0A3N4HHE4_ASCIM|nr:hypothetical protein BJ508DRAFT_313812 [Ascobolus immersus RN42]
MEHFITPADMEKHQVDRVDYRRSVENYIDSRKPVCSCCLFVLHPEQNGRGKKSRAWFCLDESHQDNEKVEIRPSTNREETIANFVHSLVTSRAYRCDRCYHDVKCQKIPCGVVGKCPSRRYDWISKATMSDSEWQLIAEGMEVFDGEAANELWVAMRDDLFKNAAGTQEPDPDASPISSDGDPDP